MSQKQCLLISLLETFICICNMWFKIARERTTFDKMNGKKNNQMKKLMIVLGKPRY